MAQTTNPDIAERNDLVLASHGNLARVQELVTQRPELINEPGIGSDFGGETPLAAASHTHNRAIAELLLASGAEHDLSTATFIGDRERVVAFLDTAPDLVQRPGIHNIPLLSFATDGTLAKLLIERGVAVNAMSRPPFQSSPLHGAARRGYVDVVEVLLANGADATAQDYNGKTPPELATSPDVQAVFARHGIATA